MFYLQPLSPADGREFYNMLQRIPPENGFENSAYTMDYGDFPAWLAKKADMARGIGLEDWMVPSSTFWLMEDGVPVGQGNIRHRLTDALRERGGHIGYAVDGTKRGRGYGGGPAGPWLRQGPAAPSAGGGPAHGHHGGASGDCLPGQRRLPPGGGGLRRGEAPGDGGAGVLLVLLTRCSKVLF